MVCLDFQNEICMALFQGNVSLYGPEFRKIFRLNLTSVL